MADQRVQVDERAALEHGLTREEFARIVERLGRVPTIEELGVFSVMWSEHCSYKSSRVHLRRLPTEGPRVIQGPGENAGAVDIGGGMAAVFKIESHNHPSYIEPYQGAATGVGGILRDVFTMGARPVASLDSLHFGAPEHERTPYLLAGVVAGIGGYGNCVGVPTVGGQTYFDAGYNGNILVNAFTIGVVPRERIFRARAAGPGNPVLYVGSKTGRDGIHGASLLASSEFKEESEQMKPTVQVGDPFTENLLIEACLEIMAGRDVVAIQDMGAAGLTSSSVEMAGRGGVGIRIDLDRVPLRDESLTPYEMLLSESQERMLLVARRGGEEKIAAICRKWGLDCVRIGEVTDDGRFTAVYRGRTVVSIPVAALTEGAPEYERPLRPPASLPAPLDLRRLPQPTDLGRVLLDLLSAPNLCSRAWIYEQYDSYVGANTVIHPGGDAAVVRVRETGGALALTTDCNSRLVALDPRLGTMHAVAEAARNIAAVGGEPIGVSDCLNFGNPEKPEIMWQFAEAIDGMAAACRAFGVPVVSGNVSFYNDNLGRSIPPTPVVAMVGLLEDYRHAVRCGLTVEGLELLLLGSGVVAADGSEYAALCHGVSAGRPAPLDLEAEVRLCRLCAELARQGMLRAAHDIADGGLAVAVAEMCLLGSVGCRIEICGQPRPDVALFGEGGGRILVAVEPRSVARVESRAQAAGVACQRLGASGGSRLVVGDGERVWIDIPVAVLERAWRATLPQIAAGGWLGRAA
ncbi:MAG: phosphoribosylformylglycinamidine synthase subunit PurL [Candidatus Dadabacteria bacterium]|nr:MAG: phosphoribosylformylglycinamidine synthase subunit PurL [Candidatus Dadabacteria bacterium]